MPVQFSVGTQDDCVRLKLDVGDATLDSGKSLANNFWNGDGLGYLGKDPV
jgi:hypothetical protein